MDRLRSSYKSVRLSSCSCQFYFFTSKIHTQKISVVSFSPNYFVLFRELPQLILAMTTMPSSTITVTALSNEKSSAVTMSVADPATYLDAPIEVVQPLKTVFQRQPYRILSDCLSFLSEDHRYWWRTTAKVIADLLEKTGYDINDQYLYLSFYYRYIIPSLGPRPVHEGQAFWKSFLTDDFSPVEPSWNWDGGKSTIRFGVEPISAWAGTYVDPFNQLMVKEMMNNIAPVSKGLDMEWFQKFEDELFIAPGDAGIILAQLPPGEHMTQSFIAFDCEGGNATAKAYFFPILKSILTGRSSADVIYDAIGKLHTDSLSLLPSLAVLQDFIASFPPDNRPRVEMAAIDCVEPSKSRIKIYVRIPHTAMNKVCDAYTLGGRLTSPSVQTGVKVLKELWPLLLHVPEGLSDDDELPSNSHRTAGTIFNFEIRPGGKFPEPKIYVPVKHYAKSDMAIAKGLSKFFALKGWNDAAQSYENDLAEVFPAHDLENSLGTHTYVSYSYKKTTGVSMTMYYSPKIYST